MGGCWGGKAKTKFLPNMQQLFVFCFFAWWGFSWKFQTCDGLFPLCEVFSPPKHVIANHLCWIANYRKFEQFKPNQGDFPENASPQWGVGGVPLTCQMRKQKKQKEAAVGRFRMLKKKRAKKIFVRSSYFFALFFFSKSLSPTSRG